MYRLKKCTVAVIYPGEAVFGFCYKVDPGTPHKQILDGIFHDFNTVPKDRSQVSSLKSRLLGLNDIVKINDKFYQRDIDDWREVTEKYAMEYDRQMSMRSV